MAAPCPYLVRRLFPFAPTTNALIRTKSSAKGAGQGFSDTLLPFTCPARPQSKSFPPRGSRSRALSKDCLEEALLCRAGEAGLTRVGFLAHGSCEKLQRYFCLNGVVWRELPPQNSFFPAAHLLLLAPWLGQRNQVRQIKSLEKRH